MRTTAHHTCKWEGGFTEVLSEAPYKAEYSVQNRTLQFLGTGYYFWDFNKEYAIIWGKAHYKGNFFVLECELDLPEDFFLDLVGRRQDMVWLWQQRQSWGPELGFNAGDRWTIGEWIEILKRLSIEENNPNIFPFKAVRAIDLNTKTYEQFNVKFVETNTAYINLNPRIVICLTEKNELLLLSKKIVYDSSKQR
jgi:hypothetical protein